MRRCRYWEGAMVLGTEGMPPEEAVWQVVNASWITHVVRAMAVLGLADQLANGPRTVVELAEATGTHAPDLSRLLRVLVDLSGLTKVLDQVPACGEQPPGRGSR